MPPGSPLVGMSHSYHFAVFVQITHKTDTGGRALFIKAIGQYHTGMPRQVGPEQVISPERGRHVHIDGFEEFRHFLVQYDPGPVGLDVFYCRDVPRFPEFIGPGPFHLAHQFIITVIAGQLIKGRRRFHIEQKAQVAVV